MAFPVETVREVLQDIRGRPDPEGMCAQCPAATQIEGPGDEFDLRILCGVMALDRREGSKGLRMNAAQAGFERNSTDAVLLRLRDDPSSVAGLCCGEEMPVLTDADDDGIGRNHYTRCPVFQAERRRLWEGRDELYPDAEPDPVSTPGWDEPEMDQRISALDDLDPDGAPGALPGTAVTS